VIRKLIATRIWTNSGVLVIFFLIHSAAFSLIYRLTARDYGVEGLDTLEREMLAALAIFVLMTVFILFREQRELRPELVARLPVSAGQAFLAEWGFAAVCLCLPTLFWVVSFVLITDLRAFPQPFLTLVYWTGFFILIAATIYALVREIVRHMLVPRRAPNVATIAALVLAGGSATVFATMRGGFTFGQLYVLALVAAGVLVALDFYRKRTDMRLG